MKYSYVLNNFKNFTFCTSVPSSDFLYNTPTQWFFCTLHPHSDFYAQIKPKLKKNPRLGGFFWAGFFNASPGRRTDCFGGGSELGL